MTQERACNDAVERDRAPERALPADEFLHEPDALIAAHNPCDGPARG